MEIDSKLYLYLLEKAKLKTGLDESCSLKHSKYRNELCKAINDSLNLKADLLIATDTIKNQRLLAGKNQKISITYKYLDPLLEFCGFKNLTEIEVEVNGSLTKKTMMRNFDGFWYSYVRKNSKGKTALLAAPVWMNNSTENGINITLKPPLRNNQTYCYSGFLNLNNVCLTGTLKSVGSKEISKIIKIGNGKPSNVLQGVFITINANNDPIAGREVLVRNNEITYEELADETEKQAYFDQLPHQVLHSTEDDVPTEINKYFERYEDNNLKTNFSNGELSDLAE